MMLFACFLNEMLSNVGGFCLPAVLMNWIYLTVFIKLTYITTTDNVLMNKSIIFLRLCFSMKREIYVQRFYFPLLFKCKYVRDILK